MFSNIFNEEFFNDAFEPFERLMSDTRLSYKEVFPPTNVMVGKDSCKIELALAGYKKEDLKFTVNKDTLIIETVENFKERSSKDVEYLINKIKSLPFKRVYSIPTQEYDLSKITVKFVDGLLTIEVPKFEEKKNNPRVISIE